MDVKIVIGVMSLERSAGGLFSYCLASAADATGFSCYARGLGWNDLYFTC